LFGSVGGFFVCTNAAFILTMMGNWLVELLLPWVWLGILFFSLAMMLLIELALHSGLRYLEHLPVFWSLNDDCRKVLVTSLSLMPPLDEVE
jgi:hypothetical protein